MDVVDVGTMGCIGGACARLVGEMPIVCTGGDVVARALLVAAVGDDGGGVARSSRSCGPLCVGDDGTSYSDDGAGVASPPWVDNMTGKEKNQARRDTRGVARC